MPEWKHCLNILCVRPDNMGDVLMSTPAIRALKAAAPGRRVTLLTSSAGAAIAALVPEIDEVIVFDVPWVKTGHAGGPAELPALIDTLAARCFDAAVLFTVYSQNPLPTAMLCYQAGIPRVLGYCRENPYGLISDWVPDPEPLELIRHEVQRQLDLVGITGASATDTRLSLTVSPPAAGRAVRLLQKSGIDTSKPWLLLHAGASEAKRRYPAADYATAMRRLVDESDYRVVLTGSAAEADDAEAMRLAIGRGAVSLAGQADIETLAALIAGAPLLVSNNTGPVHIAAAVGTPVVVLYAMTNPQHTPWQVPHRVLYFEVPAGLRSKNRFLQTFPGRAVPKASPAAIVQAVQSLTRQQRRAASPARAANAAPPARAGGLAGNADSVGSAGRA